MFLNVEDENLENRDKMPVPYGPLYYRVCCCYFSEIQLNAIQKPTDVDDVLFDLLADKDDQVSVTKFWTVSGF